MFNQAHKENEPVIFPTDTIYGIGAFFDDEKANNKIFELKNRDFTKPFPILISDFSQLEMLKIPLTNSQKLILEKYWPGRFTFLLNTRLNYSYCVLEAKIAVRMVKDLPVYEMINHFNKPVTATSANLSGQPYNPSIKSIINSFAKKVKYFLTQNDGNDKPSTIIDLTTSPFNIIRNPLNISLDQI
ncbi:MAG: Sua5/YciO/YrdC/YwlC family protein [Deferribacteraceae bacterium]|jgi:L-threonylcarbamoyladenylate synthase|nr:Sua5/YciO/YrdC/YwlC family protein [Deferribacteraceae bacterium]